jgi:hypothetical protein
MRKRCFPRYDTHIDARYCADDANREWRSCRIIKISRKGIGVVFPENGVPHLPGAQLTFTFPAAQDAESVGVQGVVKWLNRIDGRLAGGIELNTIIDEAHWLQLIYFIRQPAAQKQFINLKTMPEQALKKSLHPAPAKVVVPTAMDHIKNILNYKIL